MSQTQDSQAPDAAEIVIEHVPGFFKVHIDRSSLDVCYKLEGETKLSPEQRAFLSSAKLWGAAPTPYLPSDERLLIMRHVGEAMALAIHDDLPSAEELLDRVYKLLTDRHGETARMWYVQATVGLLLLLYTLFPMLTSFYSKTFDKSNVTGNGIESPSPPVPDDNPKVTKERILQLTYFKTNLYLLAILGGALGAGFSLLVRVGKLRIDPAVSRSSTYGEVAFRLTIGGLAGLIILFGMEANVFAGILNVSNESGLIDAEVYARTFWLIGIFSIAAGACESLVPSLLRQMSDRTISENEPTVKTKTESSTHKAETPSTPASSG